MFFLSPLGLGGENPAASSPVVSPVSSEKKVGSVQSAADIRREASLLAASKGNNTAEITRLVRLGTNLDAVSNGATAIAAAAGLGNEDVIKTLVSSGANIDAGDSEGATAIHAAAEVGRADMIDLLSSLGADIDKADNSGKRPIFVAEDNGHTAVLETLERLGVDYYKDSSAFEFARHGKMDGLRKLAERGEPLDDVQPDGSSPVLAAAANGHFDAVKFLVDEHGVDCCRANNKNETPLVLAIYGKHRKIVSFLRGAGATLGNENLDITTAEDILKWMRLTGLLANLDEDRISEALAAWGVYGEKFLAVTNPSKMHQYLGSEHVMTLDWAGFWYNAAIMHAIVQEDRGHMRAAIVLGQKALRLVDNPVARREVGRLQRKIFGAYAGAVSSSFVKSATQCTSGDVTSAMAPLVDELKKVATKEHARLASEATSKCLEKYMALEERWQMALASMPYVPEQPGDGDDIGPWVSIPMPKPSPRAIAQSVLVELKDVPRSTHPIVDLSWTQNAAVDQCPVGKGSADWVRATDTAVVNRLTHLSMVSRCWGGAFAKIVGGLVTKINDAKSPQSLGLDYKRFSCPFISNRNLLVDSTLRAKYTVVPQKTLKDALASAKEYQKKMDKSPAQYPSSTPQGKVISPADYVTDITTGVIDVENPYMVAVIFECLRDSTPGVRIAWCENNMAGSNSEALSHSAATFKLTLLGPETEARHIELGIPVPFNPVLAGKDVLCATLRIHFTGFRHIEAMTDMYGKIAKATPGEVPGIVLAEPLFLNPATLDDEVPAVVQELPVVEQAAGKKMGKLLLNAHKRGDLEKIADGME